jgi:hypothetical protein
MHRNDDRTLGEFRGERAINLSLNTRHIAQSDEYATNIWRQSSGASRDGGSEAFREAGVENALKTERRGQDFSLGGIASSHGDAVKALYLFSSRQRVRKKGLPLVGPQKLVGAAHPSRQPRRQHNEAEPGGLL